MYPKRKQKQNETNKYRKFKTRFKRPRQSL